MKSRAGCVLPARPAGCRPSGVPSAKVPTHPRPAQTHTHTRVQVLRQHVSAELEEERLAYFGSAEGRDDLYEYNQREGGRSAAYAACRACARWGSPHCSRLTHRLLLPGSRPPAGRTVLEALTDFKSARLPLEWLLQVGVPTCWGSQRPVACLVPCLRVCSAHCVLHRALSTNSLAAAAPCPRPSPPGLPPPQAPLLLNRLQPGGAPRDRPAGGRHRRLGHTLQAPPPRRVHLMAGRPRARAGGSGAGGGCMHLVRRPLALRLWGP